MRFSVFLLIVILAIASFAQAQEHNANNHSSKQKMIPVKLYGKHGHKVQCSPTDKNCKCWDCSSGYLLHCKYTC
ncbi:hypothetical protein TTHERM_01107260 (macronuclear) [Tetrahymena thermophila SB210]|uniref:Transmembrane protein n=1 Tax=Tetrahymena thermophila (strain SB210) TaxID=312017 RepID=Q22BD0_TETTS|nr:hypothetical protein TTHERM_01107260 [Tetrahymena thermophila SB210]EAR82578.1 hypothetical protein TTHERM_01107260 [Tetrahymena thermophila SB210]|eukprot:XP_001030241.1 hypothetical protein TTHERM_01107260 [Tetrahymena thermophila SB210]